MIKQISIRGYDKNFSYFVGNGAEKEIGIVDPGDPDHLIAEINLGGYVPKMILLTHTHFDHIEGVERLLEEYDIPVYVHKYGVDKINVPENLVKSIEDGDEIDIGMLKLKVLYTPGHIDDAVCYYIDEKEANDGVPKLITGDTLFVEGCGRADLEGSNAEDLFNSLNQIKKLPENTKIFPGHDYGSKPVSTLKWEKEHNRYLSCENFEEFRGLRMN